eukprot:365849-Chlamydomonas_euryale.AAC.1
MQQRCWDGAAVPCCSHGRYKRLKKNDIQHEAPATDDGASPVPPIAPAGSTDAAARTLHTAEANTGLGFRAGLRV